MKSLQTFPLGNISIDDAFWSRRLQTNIDVTIPFQYQMCKKTGQIDAFKLDWKPGKKNKPHFFWDSDVAKWLEAVAYALAVMENPDLQSQADQVIDTIARAQQEDGYLNSYFIAVEPDKRWAKLRDNHELYCAGHLIEAAVAYYQATGKDVFLNVVRRYADHIDTVFGPEEGKLKGYPGHQEIELALVKLYRCTEERRYLKLAEYFINQRGRKPIWFDKEKDGVVDSTGTISDKHYIADYTYNQAHLPVREQTTAEGHAVRACYMYAGMADIAAETGDRELLEACTSIWNNIVTKRMYITGGIGSSHVSERFTIDGDLPNYAAFSETCASIALIFFAQRMFNLTQDAVYTDVIERALYNTVCGSIGLDGKTFFYANVMEEYPPKRDYQMTYQARRYSCAVRQPWYDTSCCPPNIARLFASLGSYIYAAFGQSIYVNLYISSTAELMMGSKRLMLKMRTHYPYDETVVLTVRTDGPVQGTLALRIPGWCNDATVIVNGNQVAVEDVYAHGYAEITREWQDNDRVELILTMPVRMMRSHSAVRHNAGRAALQRGPLVYCIEAIDNGDYLNDIFMSPDTMFTLSQGTILAETAPLITFPAKRKVSQQKELYGSDPVKTENVTVTAIPYYLRANRGPTEMLVWIRESQ